MVDISPKALQKRLPRGKIYPLERVRDASRHVSRRAGWSAGSELALRHFLLDSLVAIAVVMATSLVIYFIDTFSQVANISNLYIIGTALLAARRGLYPALLASVLAFPIYDWFLIPPFHTLTVDDPTEYVALVTLLVTSILIGQLLAVVQHRATDARRQQSQTESLYEVSQAALSSSDVAEVYALALRRLCESMGLAWSRLFVRQGAILDEVATFGTATETSEARHLRQRVVEEARPIGIWHQNQNNVRIVSEIDIGSWQVSSPEGGELREVYVPLSIENCVEGVLVVGGKTTRLLTADEARFLQAFSNQLAAAVQRDRLAEQRARARALEESDRLKTALVSSVSHELKTPLTAIKASATTLLQDEVTNETAIRQELAEAINRETDRLTRLVSNLLDMSRLEAGGLRPQIEPVSIVDVVADVLDRMDLVLLGHQVMVQISETIPETPLDFVMVSQVMTNLLDNAARYAPQQATIVISADIVRDQLRVTVFNEGSYLPPEDLDRVFEKFCRLSNVPGGIGLGLAITRGLVEAHHGRIWAENVGRCGVAFTFTLPSPTRMRL